MAAGTVTYRRRHDPATESEDGASTLASAGLDATDPVRFRGVLLDTFDGRLHAAGLRLEVTTARPHATGAASARPMLLVLRGGGGAAATTGVSTIPRVADDVTPGPLRSRLARLLSERVLLPRLEVETNGSVMARRNASGKVTVRVRVHREVTVTVDGAAVASAFDEHDVVEVVELMGYPKPAAELRERLEADGWTGEPGDLLDRAAVVAGVDLGDRSIGPGVDLDPDEPAAGAFGTVLANLRDAMVVNWSGTVDDLDPEFLHDLRVAVRRTRSVLSHAEGVIAEPVRQRAREGFGWFGGLTGPPRDLDVATLEWPDLVRGLDPVTVAALDVTREHLARDRAAAHEELRRDLNGGRADALMTWWSEWLDESGAPAEATDPAMGDDDGVHERSPRRATISIAPFIAQRIRKAHGRLVTCGREITPATPAPVVHELRKDAKKLRYLIECFGGLYASSARKPYVQVLKELQDSLGEHQDADVHVARLQALTESPDAAGWSADSMVAIGQLIERQVRRRRRSRREVIERFGAFDTADNDTALGRVLSSVESP